MEMSWEEWFSGIRPDAGKLLSALAGAVCTWWAGLDAIAQALLVVQGADVLTGVLLAFWEKSPKTTSGKISSGALTQGLIKKGLEWLVVFICLSVGQALSMQGIAGAAMAYPVYSRILKREREKNAPEILRLSDELL